MGTNLGYPIACTVNPAAGSEGTLAEDLIVAAPRPGHVLVVGGGPAGMEAARTAALKGHRVTLLEAAPNLGGQVAVAKLGPRLHSIGDIGHWLEQEIYRLGVEVRTNTYADVDDVIGENPDYVIIATGALPRDNGMQYEHPDHPVPGYDLGHVISGMELFTNPGRKLGTSAVVFDDVGHYEAISAAEYLISKGLAVTFVTRFAVMGPQVEFVTRVDPALRRFAENGDFRLLIRSQLEEIAAHSCRVRTAYRGQAEDIAADTVVFINAKEPLRELYDALREQGYKLGDNLAIIGDARAPRDLHLAITEGHRLVRALV
jgi:thioredoxin reductase